MTLQKRSVEEKLATYRDFWARRPAARPIIGIDIGGWFPFRRFSRLGRIEDMAYIDCGDLDAAEYLADYEVFRERSADIPDDLIKGVAPVPAIPWMEAILGAKIRRNSDSVWADELRCAWEQIDRLLPFRENSWLSTYGKFVESLAAHAAGRYPVGLPILRGVSDLLGTLRGHTESIIDCMENPEAARRAATVCADALIEVVRSHHRNAGAFHGGYYIEQYAVWAPGPLVRLQEDASAVYSPALFSDIVLEQDQRIARAFPYSLIHLHSSSLFLLDELLSIPEIDVFEVNKDIVEMQLPEMIPHLRKIQERGKLLYLRGPLSREDLRLIRAKLAPDGLIFQAVVQNRAEADELLSEVEHLYGSSRSSYSV